MICAVVFLSLATLMLLILWLRKAVSRVVSGMHPKLQAAECRSTATCSALDSKMISLHEAYSGPKAFDVEAVRLAELLT